MKRLYRVQVSVAGRATLYVSADDNFEAFNVARALGGSKLLSLPHASSVVNGLAATATPGTLAEDGWAGEIPFNVAWFSNECDTCAEILAHDMALAEESEAGS